MINTLHLTHLIYLGWVGLHVSVYLDHHQAHFWIMVLQLLATYWDPVMFTDYASVHACYKYIKIGGGTVGGSRTTRGCCVISRGCRAASLLVILCWLVAWMTTVRLYRAVQVFLRRTCWGLWVLVPYHTYGKQVMALVFKFGLCVNQIFSGSMY